MPDGRSKWARHTMVPILDADGEVAKIFVTSSDITELVQIQKDLEESQKNWRTV